MTTLQNVAIRRLNRVFAPVATTEPVGSAIVGTAQKAVYKVGYGFNSDAVTALEATDDATMRATLQAMDTIKGVTLYKPMYKNFPKQVLALSDAELYTNALAHYFGNVLGVVVLPDYDVEAREALPDSERKITVLGAASDDDMRDLAAKIVSQGQPFNDQDKEDLVILSDYVVPQAVHVKENLVFLTVFFTDLDWSESYKTPTDVLRLASALSGGDHTLTEDTKFKLNRAGRRQVVRTLDAVLRDNDEDHTDFSMHAERWKRLIKALHVQEFGLDRVTRAVNAVYNGTVVSYNSKIEKAITDDDLDGLMVLLKARPGLFARRYMEVTRKFSGMADMIRDEFALVAGQVSTPVLIQLRNLVNGPTADVLPNRPFSTKSSNKTNFLPNQLFAVDTALTAVIDDALRGRHADTKVYFDREQAAQYAVPLAIRNATSTSRAVGRSSRIKVADGGTVRLFMHWRNMTGGGYTNRVDLDLSAFFADETFTKIDAITYYNLRNGAAHHSGDITDAPNGAAEYVDIDIAQAVSMGYRYVLLSVLNYTGQSMDEIPEAWAGAMVRNKVDSGEVFEPSTVEARFDLTVKGRSATPLAFDLQTGEIVWLDTTTNVNRNSYYNVASNVSTLTETLKAYVLANPFTVAELLELVATVVYDPNDADVVVDPTSTETVLQFV